MFGLNLLTRAIARATSAFNDLAELTEGAVATLRQQAGEDVPAIETTATPALPEKRTNGRAKASA